MLKDIFGATSWVVKERLYNPFTISFIVVWLIRHKEFPLKLFSDQTYSHKESFIISFVEKYQFLDLIIDFSFALLYLSLFYITSHISYGLTLFFVKCVKPCIVNKFDSKAYTSNESVNELRQLYQKVMDDLGNNKGTTRFHGQ